MPAIKIENLSKQYFIEKNKKGYPLLRDRLFLLFKNHLKNIDKESFWALYGINLQVEKGEVLGIIGLNGAGKSTLLKILSKITPPTAGKITINGSISSLLEVGTGFHPELSGQENIYLNGSIIGMSKQEIDRKFDEIVEFSGIGKFINTPVKKYSSGMQVRLAFSIASHLNSDILLIDEVLAVGDMQFRVKCMDKIEHITKKQDRTVIIVSHDMHMIKILCNKAALIDQGRITRLGDTNEIINEYSRLAGIISEVQLKKRKDRKGKRDIFLQKIKIENIFGSKFLKSGDKIRIFINYKSKYKNKIRNIRLSIGIFNEQGIHLIRLDSSLTKLSIKKIRPEGTMICETDELNLEKGNYFCTVGLYDDDGLQDQVGNAACFRIESNYKRYNFNNYEKYNYAYKKEKIPILIKHVFFQK